MRGAGRLFFGGLLLVLAACKVPADPEGTSDRVRGGVLTVGALAPLHEADRRAVAQLARAFDARLQLVQDDPHRLFALLEEGQIQVVAGRIPASTPFKPSVALSVPVGQITRAGRTEDQVLAFRRGENAFLVRANRALRDIAP